jgi:hypothetical protein
MAGSGTWFCTECGEPNRPDWGKCHNCDVPDWLGRIVSDLQRLHYRDNGGFCAEDGMVWPCSTIRGLPAHLT